MRYTITIDKQTAPNTFDSVLVFVGTCLAKFEECLRLLTKTFIIAGTLLKVYYKYEEEFTRVVMEIKL